MALWRMRIAWWKTQAAEAADRLRVCNRPPYCFSTVTIVEGTGVIVTF
jgi:hypothetical protein